MEEGIEREYVRERKMSVLQKNWIFSNLLAGLSIDRFWFGFLPIFANRTELIMNGN